MYAKRKSLRGLLVILMILGLLFLASCEGEEPNIPSQDSSVGGETVEKPSDDGEKEPEKEPSKEECVSHKDVDKDKKCDECGVDFIAECTEHLDLNQDHRCDYCGAEYTECCDLNFDGMCDECGRILTVDGDTLPCEECVDSDLDGRCDRCGKKLACEVCVDSDKNAKCDVCGNRVECEECVDANYNGRCDVCVGVVELKPHDCVDAEGDLICDLCNKRYYCKVCTDDDFDGVCDICLHDFHALGCIDKNKNGICEICFADVEVGEIVECDACADSDGDGWCDACGFPIIDENRKYEDILPHFYTDEALVELLHQTKPLVNLDCINSPGKSRMITYLWNSEINDFEEPIVRTLSEYYAREEWYSYDFSSSYLFLASENYFVKISSYYINENGELLTGECIQNLPKRKIADFLSPLTFGENRALDVKEIHPKMDHRWYGTGSGLPMYSRSLLFDGCEILLLYEKIGDKRVDYIFETYVLMGYTLIIYEFA